MALTFSSLIEQVEFIKGANTSGHPGKESDEGRDIRVVVIFSVFAIWVEVYDPFVPSNAELLAFNVFPNAHSLCQRVTLYLERVSPEYCLRRRFRTAARPHNSPRPTPTHTPSCLPVDNHHVGTKKAMENSLCKIYQASLSVFLLLIFFTLNK